MKKLTILCLGVFGLSTSQAQDVLWENSYGGKQADYLLDAQPTADYGFILAGASLSLKGGNKEENNVGDLDYWIWKMDENGGLDWQKNIGGTGSDLLYSIQNTKDGGLILAGTSESGAGVQKKDSCRGKEDIWIIKLNAKGGEEWQRTLGGDGHDFVKSIIQTTDRGYLIGGSSSSAISPLILKGQADPYGKAEECRGSLDYWIIKLDEKGEIKWQKTYGGLYHDELESVEQTKDGGYIIGGYSNSPTSRDKAEDSKGEGDYWILKLDKDGEIEWQLVLGGEKDDHLFTIKQTKDGGYIAGGNSVSGGSGNKSKSNIKGTDIWLVKLSETSKILWQETYHTGEVDVLTSLIENVDGTLLLGGYAQSEVRGKQKIDKKEINDYLVIKISPEGEELWKTAVGSNGEDILRKVVETRDRGYLLAGTSKGTISRDKNSGKGSNDFWVVKLKDKDKEEEKARYKIEAIPNPAQQFTNVIVGFEFDTGTASLYDLSGRQLQSFTVENRTIPVDMSRYPQGVYIMEVATNTGTASVKIMKGKN